MCVFFWLLLLLSLVRRVSEAWFVCRQVYAACKHILVLCTRELARRLGIWESSNIIVSKFRHCEFLDSPEWPEAVVQSILNAVPAHMTHANYVQFARGTHCPDAV